MIVVVMFILLVDIRLNMTLQTGDLVGVVSATSRGLSMQPDHLKCLLLRAAAYRSQGLLEQSLEDVNRATACHRDTGAVPETRPAAPPSDGPVTVAALMARASVLSRVSTPAVGSDDPDIVRQRNLTLNAMAIRHRVQGRHAEAIKLFNQIVDSESSCIQFLINRADTRLEARDYLQVIDW